MSKIAFIYDGFTVYWSPLVIAAAVAVGIILAFGIIIAKKQSALAFAVMLPPAFVFSMIFARLIHWYCCTDRYDSLAQAFSDFSVGGFSLVGIVVGCIFAALIVRGLGLTKNLSAFLDCLAPAAALSVALGRLSFLFNSADRGKILIENPANQHLPLGSAVINTTSGAVQWRFATFFFQSMIAAVIFVAVLVLLVVFSVRKYKNGKKADGAVSVIFLTLFFAGEVILDSTRYDAIFLRSNGFVSLMQIFGLVILLALTVILTVRSIKMSGFGVKTLVMIIGVVAGLGAAGYMEYYVQRHGNLYMMCYTIMAIGLIVTSASVIYLMLSTIQKRVKYVPKH